MRDEQTGPGAGQDPGAGKKAGRRGRGGSRRRGSRAGRAQRSDESAQQGKSGQPGKSAQHGSTGRHDRARKDERRQHHESRRAALREARAERSPLIEYPAELPVVEHREEIAEAIAGNQVVVIAGETGSGKTTQIPKICLELGLGVNGMIGHTQPRRIAARSVAARLAEEMGEDLGGTVGYQVRFTSQVADHTRVKVMTDGILLSELRHDRLLRDYEVLIIDEAHERSLNIDFIIGFLTRLLRERPELKVIITSATINPEAFSEHFGGAPIISVSGRTYPVEVRYRPLDPAEEGEHARAGGASAAGEEAASAADGMTAEDGLDPEEAALLAELRALEAEEAREAEDARNAQAASAARGTSAQTPAARGTATQASAARGARAPVPARREPKDQIEGILDAVDELSAEPDGDILVFLSGEREIRDAADALAAHVRRTRERNRRYPDWEVVPLFARLTAAEQQRVFAPHSRPRVVLATNVAETSLTVPGIRYVVDTGVARISRYSNRTKVQRLPIEPVSQASANQRKGRSGRTSEGICIRLFSEADFESRPEFTDPEILRTNLASVILQMVTLGFAATEAEVAEFPFLTPPDPRAVRDGRALLNELGALRTHRDGRLSVTATGRKIAALPIDPRLARMVLAGAQHGCGAEVAVIVAALSLQDPRERPVEQRGEADAAHARFAHPTSDFLSFLALWNYVRSQSQELSGSKFRKTLRAEFLNYVRIREWQDLVSQLRSLAGGAGIQLGQVQWAADADDSGEAIHRALLTGLLSMIGQKTPDNREYQGARGTRFAIFPGSGLFKRKPDFVMAAELVETSRLWARTVAAADPDWAVAAAGDLVKRTHADPHWSQKSGQALAHEKATLYGVTLYAERPVSYARIDREHARELFLRHALVHGEWREQHAFQEANAATLAEAEEFASRSRDRRVLEGEDALCAFYAERVPLEIATAGEFTGWWRKKRREDPAFLDVPLSRLLAEGAEDRSSELARLYPTHWELPAREASEAPARAELRYSFEPGTEGDGVTAEIQLRDLDRADPHAFSWQVPGLRAELTAALIRSLPKAKRTYFVPAPDVARDILAALAAAGEEGVGSLPEVLAVELSARAGGGRLEDRTPITVHPEDFDLGRVPGHLRMRFRLMRGGRRLAESFDLAELQREQRRRRAEERSGAAGDVGGAAGGRGGAAGGGGAAGSARGAERRGAEHRGREDRGQDRAGSPSGTLPGRGGGPEAPTRVDLVDAVVSGAGAVLAYVREHLSTQEKLVLAAHQKRTDELLTAVLRVAARGELAAAGIGPEGWSAQGRAGEAQGAGAAADPEALARSAQAGLPARMDALLPSLVRALEKATVLDRLVSSSSSLVILANLTDVGDWRQAMCTAEGVGGLSEAALLRLPVWVEAACVRVRAMADQPPRDRQLMDRTHAVEAAVDKKLRTVLPEAAALGRASRLGATVETGGAGRPGQVLSHPGEGWHAVLFQLEELRLSLFAPALGAMGKVSEQRVQKALAKL
ncbi:ATP-dependent RNA helicase HrpA [Brevibacterium album]|uniref:ATP-dependent RNA helicase HrpA n=1 Tax=Brevibacterium album TaxID=417948 RepID=UPI0012EC4A39|nr:ATP-dependent RNA helicase HrpA [Brevibacterium album]